METTTTDDMCEARARALHIELLSRGIDNQVHWDRSPWGVRIWLTHDDGPEYRTPSLFVLTEGERRIGHPNCWKWVGCLGGFSETTDQTLQDVFIEIVEWGDDEATQLDTVATAVVTFLRLLIIQEVTEDE